MAELRLTVSPGEGSLSINEGDSLVITTVSECTFSCDFGNCFAPGLSSAQLVSGENGPYTAQQSASGSYTITETVQSSRIEVRAMAAGKSIQISPP